MSTYEFWCIGTHTNTFGSAAEQLAECFAKQVSSRGQSTSHAKPARSVKMSYEYLTRWCKAGARVSLHMSSDIGHAHSSTHRMRLSPGALRDPIKNGIHFVHRLWGQKAHDYYVTEHADARIRAPIYTDSGSVPGYACQYVGLALQNEVFMQTKTNGNHSQCREMY